ncbi:MAG: hypothetical protein JWR67_3163 [Mucilaginibacter sp.]|nr:hypothetical protein [Mucilaginibacter sp.]MDB5112049.1 hypothetical protein [Mucilaginibacter sp.]
MKKVFLLTVLSSFFSVYSMAQETLSFPFQGGHPIMTRFFKDSLKVSPEIISKKATGTAVFKFTADERGTITKIVIYYADDLLLTPPIIAALKKSNHKWIIPDKEKFHDFIIPFSISFDIPMSGNSTVQKAYYDFYLHHKPFPAVDQIPLNDATLLPTVFVKYTF